MLRLPAWSETSSDRKCVAQQFLPSSLLVVARSPSPRCLLAHSAGTGPTNPRFPTADQDHGGTSPPLTIRLIATVRTAGLSIGRAIDAANVRLSISEVWCGRVLVRRCPGSHRPTQLISGRSRPRLTMRPRSLLARQRLGDERRKGRHCQARRPVSRWWHSRGRGLIWTGNLWQSEQRRRCHLSRLCRRKPLPVSGCLRLK
jgi:hypothetical protein